MWCVIRLLLFFIPGSFFLVCCDNSEKTIYLPESQSHCLLIENTVASRFLNAIEYDDDNYSYSCVTEYKEIETNYRKDWPEALFVHWNSCKDIDSFELKQRLIEISDNNTYYRKIFLSVQDTSYLVTNFIPGVEYSICVKDVFNNGDSKILYQNTIKTLGRLRMLSIDGIKMANLRDLGGWKAGNGYIKYGRLIRGGEVYRDDTYKIQISDIGIQQLIEDVGVNVEIDFGDFSSFSPLYDYGVEFFHGEQYQIDSYQNGINTIEGRLKFKNCITLIVDKLLEGKNIFFHCNSGADRTGTLAFIIEGLLGVSESDMAKEYELTSFSMFGERLRNSVVYYQLVSFFKENYPGKYLRDQIYNMAITPISEGGMGLSPVDISLLRQVLIDEGN